MYAGPPGNDDKWTANFGFFNFASPGLDLLETPESETLHEIYDELERETACHPLLPICRAQTDNGQFAEAAITFATMCVDSCRAVATKYSTQEWDCGLLYLPEVVPDRSSASSSYSTKLLAIYRQPAQTRGSITNDGLAVAKASEEQSSLVLEEEPDRLTSGLVRRSTFAPGPSLQKQEGSFCSVM